MTESITKHSTTPVVDDPRDPPVQTRESIERAQQINRLERKAAGVNVETGRPLAQQLRANVEANHARRFPHGCDLGCDECLIRVRLPEARAMLDGRTRMLPTLDHLRALWLHYKLMTEGR